MNRIQWNSLDAQARRRVMQRPFAGSGREVEAAVAAIVAEVREGGDSALRELTRRFDSVDIGALEVSKAEFEEAMAAVPSDLLWALREARERLLAWHRAGMESAFEIETAPGVRCGRILRGIGRVGLYVPSGTAPLISSALMQCVPAELAQCPEVILCTPPRADGRVDAGILVAARLCGVHRVFRVGGAQAIAAMAFGTETMPACDKLFGPGNRYVAAAKQHVATLQGGPAMDLPAGPSELLVIADSGARAASVAADLLSQAEHGEDSQVILVTDCASLLEATLAEVQLQLEELPRAAVARASLAHARLILVDCLDDAFALANDYAAEHLILALRDPATWLDRVQRAGSVFMGYDACETLGDYCSGTNHVLPTNGAARSHGGLCVASFQISISVQSVTREGLRAIGPCAVTLARAEALEGHAKAVTRRLDMLSEACA